LTGKEESMDTTKGMEKVIVTKEAKALLPIINKQEMRPHFRGFLIKGDAIVGTDSKILVKMPLNTALPKEEIPTNIRTGADTDKVWVSIETLKKAVGNIPKKSSLPAIQENIYIAKENGALKLQVLDENMNVVSFEERGTENLADDFPDAEAVLNPKDDVERKTIRIAGETIIKLADMAKSLGKDLSITMEIADSKHPVFFKIADRNCSKANGVFMLLKPEE
jgi:hypothetical protein